MKKLDKKLFVLFAILATSGCLGLGGGGGTPTAVSGNGLVITNFTADQSSVFENKTVRLFFNVENQGESTVSKGTTLILLLGSNIGNSIGSWRVEAPDRTGDGNGDVLLNLSKDLNPADSIRGVPAGRDSFTWRLRSPENLAKGEERPDAFVSRVYYDYKTTSSGTIWFYSEAEASAARDRGEVLQKSSFIATRGPLSVSVSTAPDPVIVPGGGETYTLSIVITNVGGGVLLKPGKVDASKTDPSQFVITEDDLNKPTVIIRDQDGNQVAASCTSDVELIQGKSTTISCDINEPSPPSAKTGKAFKVEATYGYYIDRSITVTALGK